MSRVSDMQIEEQRELDPSEFMINEPFSDDDWNVRELGQLIKGYEDRPGYEEIVGTLVRAKVLLEQKVGF